MKMGKFIISAILIFALTNYAYGLGSGSHHHHRNSGGNGATVQALNDSGSNGENGATGGSVAPVSVPEPATLLLLGSGLIGLAGLARKKFKK